MSFGNRLDSIEEDENKKNEQKQRVWFEFSNQTLYTPLSETSNVSIARNIFSITDALSMDLNNMTRLELAFDSTRNFANKIKRAVMKNGIVPVVNGTARKDVEEVINEIKYLRTGNQLRYKTLSVYVRPKSDKKLELRAYNKTDEIIHSRKDYIRQFTGMPKNFHRVEIAVQNEAIKDFLNLNKMDVKEFYSKILSDVVFRKDAYLYFSNRLLRFQTPDGVKSVLEI